MNIEMHQLVFDIAAGDTKQLFFTNSYTSPPVVSANCKNQNMNVYIGEITNSYAFISISAFSKINNITVDVHVISN